MFFCYKITNLINNKVYIGKTNNAMVRWRSHRSCATNISDPKYSYPISNAIRKYGIDNFKFEILYSCNLEQEAFDHEIYFISLYRSNRNIHGKLFGYNLTNGGEGVSGWKPTIETRNKMSASHKGILHTEESRIKIGLAHKGTHHTEVSCEKIRQFNIGKKFSKETLIKISGENSGSAKLTWEIVNKIREDHKDSQFTQKQLAEKYEVSQQNIYKIISNRSWKNAKI